MAVLHRDTIRHINAKDYSKEAIDAWSSRPSPDLYQKGVGRCKRWVAEIDGEVVGYTDHGLNGKFWGLYVHKDHLGKGIGSALFQKAEESLQQMGVDKITIESTITATKFYEGKGYTKVRDDTHIMNGIQIPTVILEKTL